MTIKTHSQAAYRRVVQQLLPPGDLFNVQPGSNLDKLLNAIATRFAEVDGVAAQIADEAHPDTVLQLLPETNVDYGLPDDCAPTDQTVDQQRGAILAKVNRGGTVTLAFLEDQAAKLGFEVTAVKRHGARFGTLYGQFVYGDTFGGSDWNYLIEIHAPLTNVEQRVYGEIFGSAFSSWGNELLECTLNALIGVGKLQFIYS